MHLYFETARRQLLQLASFKTETIAVHVKITTVHAACIMSQVLIQWNLSYPGALGLGGARN